MATKTERIYQGSRDIKGRPVLRYGLPGQMRPLPWPFKRRADWGRRGMDAWRLAWAIITTEMGKTDDARDFRTAAAFRDRMVCHWLPHGWAISGRVVRLTVAQIEKDLVVDSFTAYRRASGLRHLREKREK